jgi:hypothetical protein
VNISPTSSLRNGFAVIAGGARPPGSALALSGARVSKDGRESLRCVHPWFDRITDAIENERKLKKWSRAKKEALIRGDFESLQQLAKRKSPHPSRRPPAAGSSG